MKLRRIFPSSRIARTAVSLAVPASLVAISVIVTGATGGAPQSSEEENPLEADAESYAADFGTTVEEAMRRLSLQNEIGKLDEQLTANEGPTFAGLWIKHEPEFAVIVKFTENGGANTIQPYLRGGNLADLVEVGEAKTTLAALRRAQADVIALGNRVDTDMETRVNVIRNKVEASVLNKSAFEADLTAAGETLPAKVNLVEVRAFSRQANGDDSDAMWGGLTMRRTDTGQKCTSGFTVEHDNGTKGITTAEHCGDPMAYDVHTLPHQDGRDSGSIDLQWFTAPDHNIENKIYDGPGSSGRSITTTLHRNNQPIGAYLCTYGVVSGYRCGQLIHKDINPAGDYNATWMQIHRPNENFGQGGDSGSPMFSGSAAWGTLAFLTAHLDLDGNETGIYDGLYMASNYFSELDLEILTE